MIAKIIDAKTIYIFDKGQFDWDAIKNSGQLFRDPPCDITEESGKIIIKATGEKNSDWLWNYFDLDTDYTAIKQDLMQYAAMQEPIKLGQGIRILRQPLVETIVCFICSAANNIPRIKSMVQRLCENYGRGEFPTIETLLKISKDEFDAMRFGKHGKNLIKALPQIAAISVEGLGELPRGELSLALTKIHGVGPKVRDCIMLFASPLHRLDVAPVDTWIRKAIAQLDQKQASEIFNHKYAGVAQQYIFYYLQHLRKEL
jgi:N-glycosylase/DNA lyase